MAVKNTGEKSPSKKETKKSSSKVKNRTLEEKSGRVKEDVPESFAQIIEEKERPEGGHIDSSLAEVETVDDADARERYFTSVDDDRAQDYKDWGRNIVLHEEVLQNRAPASADQFLPGGTPAREAMGEGWLAELGDGFLDYIQRFENTYGSLSSQQRAVVDAIKSHEGAFIYDIMRNHGGLIVGGVGLAALAPLVGMGLTATTVAGALGLASHSYAVAKTSTDEEIQQQHDNIVGTLTGVGTTFDNIKNMTDEDKAAWIFLNDLFSGGVARAGIKGLATGIKSTKRFFTPAKSIQQVQEEVLRQHLVKNSLKESTSYKDMLEEQASSLSQQEQNLLGKLHAMNSVEDLAAVADRSTFHKGIAQHLENWKGSERSSREITEALVRRHENERFLKEYDEMFPAGDGPSFMAPSKLPMTGPQKNVAFEQMAGKDIDIFRRSGGKNVESIQSYASNLRAAIKDMGTKRTTLKETTKEAVKKSVKETPSEKALPEGTIEGGTKSAILERDIIDLMELEKKVVMEFGENAPQLPAINMGRRMQEAFREMHGSHTAKNLVDYRAADETLSQVRKLHDRRMRKVRDLKNGIGDSKSLLKDINRLDNGMKDIQKEIKKGGIFDATVSTLVAARASNLLASAALPKAVLGTIGTTALQNIDLAMRTGAPLSVVTGMFGTAKGVATGLGKAWLTKKGWARRMAEWSGKHVEKGRANLVHTTARPLKGVGHAASTVDLQLMREADYGLSGGADYIAARTSLHDLIMDMAEEGKSLTEIKTALSKSVLDKEVPQEFAVKYLMRKQHLSDKSLFRADRGTGELMQKSLLSDFGWLVHAMTTGMNKRGMLGKLGASYLAPFSRSAANALDWSAEYSLLGSVGGKGRVFNVTPKQLRGTLYAIGAFTTADNFDRITYSGSADQRSKFRQFGGKKGITIGGEQWEFAEFGVIGEVMDISSGIFESFNYFGYNQEENGDVVMDKKSLEFLGPAFAKGMGSIINNTWMGMGLTRLAAVYTSDRPPGAFVKKVLKEDLASLTPGGGLARRTNVASRGFVADATYFDELQEFIGMGKQVLIDAPARDSLGVAKSMGEHDEARFRRDDEDFDFSLFFNPVSSTGKFKKSIELRDKMVEFGVLRGAPKYNDAWRRVSHEVASAGLKELAIHSINRPHRTAKMLFLPGQTITLTPRQYNIKLEGLSLDWRNARERLKVTEDYLNAFSPNNPAQRRAHKAILAYVENFKKINSAEGYRNMIKNIYPGYSAEKHRLVDVLHYVSTVPYGQMSGVLKRTVDAHRRATELAVRGHARLRARLSEDDIRRYSESLGRSRLIKDLYDELGKSMGEGLIALDPEILQEQFDIMANFKE